MLKVTIQLRREKGEYPVEFAFDNISETGIHAGMYWVRSTDGTTRIPIDRIASVTEEPVPTSPDRRLGEPRDVAP